MFRRKNSLSRKLRTRDERGATATEYGLLVLFLAFAIVLGLTALGNGLNQAFTNLAGVVVTIDDHF